MYFRGGILEVFLIVNDLFVGDLILLKISVRYNYRSISNFMMHGLQQFQECISASDVNTHE